MSTHRKTLTQQGFTLVELSIVLIIIGFIIAGIAAGSSLVHSARLQSIITEQNAFITAINSFQSKYSQLPGDMKNADSIWPTAAGNGNGDGKTQWYVNPPLDRREGLLAWQHLALSGFIPGNYDGGITSGTPLNESIAGLNSPASKYTGGLWAISTTSESNINGNPSYADLRVTGNFIFIGSRSSNNMPDRPLLIPQDANSIDNKIDDGQPLTGNVFGRNGCLDNSFTCNFDCLNSASNVYSLNNSDTACYMGFMF